MQARPFVPYTTDHLSALGVMGLGVLGLLVARPWLHGREDRGLRQVIALGLIGNGVLAVLVAAARGVPRVPLQFCDVALGVTAWALLTAQPRVSEVAYCWGVGGSLQAVLTPDLRLAFPSFWWITFFVGHVGVVLSAVYLAVTGRVRLTRGAVGRAWLWANGYAVMAGGINGIWGTNYGYLARKPLQPSLLDYFGPWPVYILVMEVAALVIFSVCAVPWWLARGTARRRRA